MTIEEKILDHYPSLTKSGRRVADYLLEHLHEAGFLTLDAAARCADTSTTSVLRFCRAMGYAGYKEFQKELHDEFRERLSLPERFKLSQKISPGTSLLGQIVNDGIGNIERTFSDTPEPALEEAARLLSEARRLFTFGMRESYALAHYAYTHLQTVREQVTILDLGYNGMIEQALDLTPEDVCLFFLFHRYTAQSVRTLQLIREHDIRVVLVTSPPFDKVAPYADLLIPCYNETSGIKNSGLAAVCLIDYLCNAVAALHSEETLQRLGWIEETLKRSRLLG